MGNYKSYKEAYRKGKEDVWPCGKRGKYRVCGRIHNFYTKTGNKIINDFRCWHNKRFGCPLEPEEFTKEQAKKFYPERFL